MSSRRPGSADSHRDANHPPSVDIKSDLYFHFAFRLAVPMTRAHVRLLGPCFKTGPESTQSGSVADGYVPEGTWEAGPRTTPTNDRSSPSTASDPRFETIIKSACVPGRTLCGPIPLSLIIPSDRRSGYRRSTSCAETTRWSTRRAVDRHPTGRDVLLEEKCTTTTPVIRTTA